MDLAQFFDHVYLWAESLWQDRVEADPNEKELGIDDNPSSPPKKDLNL